jgi:hypothetical protein
VYDDDDVYLQIKEDEHKFQWLWGYWEVVARYLGSDIAITLYVSVCVLAVLYLLYYLFTNHELLKLSRTKSGYSLVA